MNLPVDYTKLTQREQKAVREEYVRVQGGKCSYCDKPLTDNADDIVMKAKINVKLFPIGFFKSPVHLHHSHATGLTIGAVHSRCNAALWQYHGE